MRIDRIDVIRVLNPFKHPFQTSFTKFENRDALLVKVYSEGLIGWGECKAFYGPFYNPEDNGTVFHILKDFIIPGILHQEVESPAAFMEEFAYIKGNLEVKTNGYVVIDVNGIGYKIFMSETAINKLGQIGEIVKIHTYVRVREDDISIFGFNTNEELRMFELLLSVSGIGAKSALVILSNVSVSSFALAIINNDVNLLKKLPGIGPKTAQRVILELKDKLKKENEIVANEDREVSDTIKAAIIDDEKIAEATAALKVLGYTGKEIEKALEKVDANLSVEDIIRKGLLNLAR